MRRGVTGKERSIQGVDKRREREYENMRARKRNAENEKVGKGVNVLSRLV